MIVIAVRVSLDMRRILKQKLGPVHNCSCAQASPTPTSIQQLRYAKTRLVARNCYAHFRVVEFWRSHRGIGHDGFIFAVRGRDRIDHLCPDAVLLLAVKISWLRDMHGEIGDPFRAPIGAVEMRCCCRGDDLFAIFHLAAHSEQQGHWMVVTIRSDFSVSKAHESHLLPTMRS
jgi:hypothetical protein